MPPSPTTPQDDFHGKTFISKLRIAKNLIFLSIGGFLSFCAYDGLNILQSTLNREDGIGVISVSLQSGCGCLTALLFAKYSIRRFGSKMMIIATSCTYSVYVVANFYPNWYLLVPASVLVGMANALFWVAQCQYLNRLSILYAGNLMKKKELKLVTEESFDNAGHCCEERRNCYEANYGTLSIGNDKAKLEVSHNGERQKLDGTEDCNGKLVASFSKSDTFESDNHVFKLEEMVCEKTVVQKSDNKIYGKKYQNECEVNNLNTQRNINTLPKENNYSSEIVVSTTSRMFGFHGFIYQTSHIFGNLLSYYILKRNPNDHNHQLNSTCFCGADFCNVESECFINNLQEPSYNTVYILLGTFTALSILAVLIVVLVVDELEKKEEALNFSLDVLLASFSHMKNKYEILLTPSVLLIGIEVGLAMGDFTKAYVGCAWGIHHVGLVMTCFGACLSVSCSVSGFLVHYVGRIPVFLAAEVAALATGILMLRWRPDAEHVTMFFVLAGLLGAHLGIMWSQIRAFYGVLFRDDEEVAFGNYNVFHSIGSSIAFGYSNYLCMTTKIYIFLTMSLIGCIGYLIAEKSLSNRKSIK